MASWQSLPFLPCFPVGYVLCTFCLLLAGASLAQDQNETTGFYFIANQTAMLQGIAPSPYNASNITRWLPATNFPPGGPTLCLTQAIPSTNTGSEDLNAAGRALYYKPIRLLNATTKSVLSFSTTFSFWIQTTVSIYPIPGDGLAFIMAPDNNNSTTGEAGKYLGWLNETTNNDLSGHNFAIEFDIFQDVEFGDIDNNHVGVNFDSLNSSISRSAGAFEHADSETASPMLLTNENSGNNVYVWIDYDGSTQVLSVTVNLNITKPPKPLISQVVNLTGVLNEFMYVGFTAATGDGHMAQHTVYDWSFSTDGPAVNVFGSSKDESKEGAQKREIMIPVAISVTFVVLLLVLLLIITALYFRYYRKYKEARRKRFQVTELDNLEYGPHKFSYKDLSDATHKFSANEELGRGGFGSVYKGVVPDSGVVAVKRICKKSKQGPREFIAEVKIIGRMRHRNLVPLLGWCHEKSKRELLLVYEYMPNGSLDKFIFQKAGSGVCLPWEQRAKILNGVATALQFLHEEYEQRVVHRDVKASNVMLDADFNARLGDFGLARLYDHACQEPKSTTHIAGTFGYMAPELTQDGKVTEKTDVFSFGALALEVATGRMASEKVWGKHLVDWVWSLFSSGEIMAAVDSSLGNDYDAKEMTLVLHTGLLCSHPDPDKRPTMRQSLSYLKGEVPFPVHMLPHEKPLPMFAFSMPRSAAREILFSNNGSSKIFTDTPNHLVDIDGAAVRCNMSAP